MEGFEIGSRVKDADGYRATVRYIGPVAAAKKQDEIWLGVEWDRQDRGKHDGSCVDKAGNLHRYFECANGAGSFVKGNKVGGGISFMQAIQERYVDSDAPAFTKENDPTLPGAFVTTSKGNAKPIEFLGEHKLRKWQQISAIDKVAIRDDRIATIGEGLKEVAGHLTEVDLQGNLLWKWSEVGKLTCDIEGLKKLVLHSNRMQKLEKTVLSACPAGSFAGLRTLALNSCNITSWAQVQLLEPSLMNIEELYLSANSLTDLPKASEQTDGGVFTGVAEAAAAAEAEGGGCSCCAPAEPVVPLPPLAEEGTWKNLRILDMSGCAIEEWSQVAFFSRLPALQELVVDSNPMPQVQCCEGDSFASLQRISISGTGLSAWSDVDAIASYPSVSNVRMSSIPLFRGKGASQVRPIVISRVKNLGFFNGSIVGRRERFDGEKGYLRSVMMDIDEATKAGRPMSQEAIAAKHPRYEELNALHGADVVPGGSSTTGGSMASELLTVTFLNLSFSSGGSLDPVTKKVPSSVSIMNMKMMVKQLFGLDPALQQLSWSHKEYQDSPPVWMDDDQAPLAYYGAVDGSDIFINEAKAEGEEEGGY